MFPRKELVGDTNQKETPVERLEVIASRVLRSPKAEAHKPLRPRKAKTELVLPWERPELRWK